MADFTQTKGTDSITCVFSSDLDNIDRAVESLMDFIDTREMNLNRFETNFVLREALNNAVIHGNNKKSQLQVICTLAVGKNDIKVTVRDEGQGFDWRSRLEHRHAISSETSGRGLKTISDYDFDIRYNEMGNTLYLTKKIL